MTAASVVVDASALIRAAVEHHPAARRWTHAIETGRVRGHVPELVYAELPSALAQSVRAGLLEARDAGEILDRLLQLPVRRHTQSSLAAASLTVALELGLSAYDASYLALAQTLAAPLVTADRRLASVAPAAELIP